MAYSGGLDVVMAWEDAFLKALTPRLATADEGKPLVPTHGLVAPEAGATKCYLTTVEEPSSVQWASLQTTGQVMRELTWSEYIAIDSRRFTKDARAVKASVWAAAKAIDLLLGESEQTFGIDPTMRQSLAGFRTEMGLDDRAWRMRWVGHILCEVRLGNS